MTALRGKVVGIGLAVLDLLLLWDDMARPVVEATVTECEFQGGGMVATALVAAARLGARTEFRGRVGADWMGELMLQGLREEDVDVRRVRQPPGSSGPLAVVCVDGDGGERHFKRFLRSGLGAEELEGAENLEGAGCLLVDGTLPEATTRAARRARELGIPVVADFGGNLGGGRRRLMQFVDHAILDERAIAGLATQGGARAACEAARQMGPHHVAITRGERGVASLDGQTYRELDAFSVDVVDTTGAGDVFHGAFCYGLVAGYEVEANLVFSSAVAAMKCTRLGGRAGIPTLQQVRDFLRERDIEPPALP